MNKKLNKLAKKIDEELINTVTHKTMKVFGLVNKDLEKVKLSEPYLVMKYNQNQYECFSNWEKSDISALANFIEKLQKSNWEDIIKGKGWGYKNYDINKINNSAQSYLNSVKNKISEEINFFELRVSQKARVHGFRSDNAFFLVLFDKNHQVFPQ